MEKVKVIAAPGPVSYPLIAARDESFSINFQKEGRADIVLDSSVSMVRRGIPIDLSLIRGLAIASPDLGKRIGIVRRGSSSEILVRAILGIQKREAEIVSVDEISSIPGMMKSGNIDSAVVPAPFGKGKTLEKILSDLGIQVPGSCVASVREDLVDRFTGAYSRGIDLFRRSPDESASYVSSVLPNHVSPDFIKKVIMETDVSVIQPGKHSEFTEIVRKYSQ